MNIGAIVFDGTLWIAIPISVLAGLISFLSPCVLPLIPGYLGYLASAVTGDQSDAAAKTSRSRLLLGVLLFIGGFTVVFIALAIFSGALGSVFIQYSDLITRILGAVVVVMGLIFIGWFGVAQKTIKPRLRSRMGLIGAPLLGVAMGIGWTPCMGPTLSAIMALSWNVADPWRAGLLGFAYAMGLGIPFILITLGWSWATKSVAFLRRHIRAINIAGGVLLVLLGVLMVSGVWSWLMSSLGAVIQVVETPL